MADKEPAKKTYKLKARKWKVCYECRGPLTSDTQDVCAACAARAPKEEAPAKGPTVEPGPEPTTLDAMKEIFAEVERQNAEDDQITAEVKARFSIRDVGSANWAAGKIAMWQNEVDRRKAQAKEYIAEAERNVRRLSFLFMTQLEAWAKVNIPQDKRSLKLPLATLKFTETQDKIEVRDEGKVVAWATVNLPDAVEMKASLIMLKDYWLASEKETVPDGCAEVPKQSIFKVE
jgi:hypothetical protein